MKIAIIGCGVMGTAIAIRLAKNHTLFFKDREKEKADELAKITGGLAFDTSIETIKQARFIFLAIKPGQLKESVEEIQGHLSADQVIISLLAGTPLEVLNAFFPDTVIVRMMPNLAIRHGKGVIGLVDSSEISRELKTLLNQMIEPLGMVYWLNEEQINGLTALTGSGPAFVMMLIESMIDSGIALGFQSKDARKLIIQMINGCTALLQEGNQHPAEIRWQIASPGGTTIEGIRTFEKEKIRSGLIETFLSAHAKAEAMDNKTPDVL